MLYPCFDHRLCGTHLNAPVKGGLVRYSYVKRFPYLGLAVASIELRLTKAVSYCVTHCCMTLTAGRSFMRIFQTGFDVGDLLETLSLSTFLRLLPSWAKLTPERARYQVRSVTMKEIIDTFSDHDSLSLYFHMNVTTFA